ncbi:hypothetical protein CXB65_15370 [Pseudomonas monteilii]|uniref:Uncharacterized protein n=1 Tax=Pseudomonas monteilii TaxID=76759 RepID=A0A2N1IRR0_9PSED|nr:hypothetical protein CXB65_15370 [Pseudomonas monteilii]RPD94910.1 hypothetical protein EGN69_01720 [Pseudomonas monteilii]
MGAGVPAKGRKAAPVHFCPQTGLERRYTLHPDRYGQHEASACSIATCATSSVAWNSAANSSASRYRSPPSWK